MKYVPMVVIVSFSVYSCTIALVLNTAAIMHC